MSYKDDVSLLRKMAAAQCGLTAFLRTLTPVELAVLRHDARAVGDAVLLAAVLAEFKRLEKETPHGV